MAEYIKKEDVQNIIYAEDIDPDFPRMDISARVHDIPAEDVAPVVHGKWEAHEDNCLSVNYCCSACGENFHNAISYNINGVKFVYNYCPNCGAKMDKGE